MEYMLVFADPADARGRATAPIVETQRIGDELGKVGTLRRAAMLTTSAGARVRVRDGAPLVTGAPVVEDGQILSGFWVVEVESRDDALEIARRCVPARSGRVEVTRVHWRDGVADRQDKKGFALLFRMEPGLSDCDGAKMREMVEFQEPLKADGSFVETAPLSFDPPVARVEARGGRISVTDGPFAETKEGVGGYTLVRLADLAAAIELARRFPHARWGPVEVREMV